MRWLGHRLHAEMVLGLDPALSFVESEAIADHISHHLYHLMPMLTETTISAVPWQADAPMSGHESAHHRSA
jgi:divalent metal cation (Fe/Co/Zn/Cd) transporter